MEHWKHKLKTSKKDTPVPRRGLPPTPPTATSQSPSRWPWNSLTKEQSRLFALKLETILLVWALSLCRVLGKFFLVNDLITFMSKPSVSSSHLSLSHAFSSTWICSLRRRFST